MRRPGWRGGPLLAAVLAVSLVATSGCAAMFRGRHQIVRLDIQPPGHVVVYEGRTLRSGDKITVEKWGEPPRVSFAGEKQSVQQDLQFSADPWLIADTALLLLGIIPGLIALGVDFGTGTWRKLDDPQRIYEPAARPAASVGDG